MSATSFVPHASRFRTTSHASLRWAIAVMVSVAAGPLASAEIPTPSLASKSIPGADKATAPDIIKPGTRLVYFGTNAMHPFIRERLILNEQNAWVGEKTRQPLLQGIGQGSGGVGYTVARVGHLDKDAALVAMANYLFDRQKKTVTPAGTSAVVSNAGSACDLWLNPAVLKAVQEVNQEGNQITRMPYVLNKRQYNALRFQTETRSGSNVMVYDLDSGLVLFRASTVYDFNARNRGPEGQELQAGQTHTSTSTLVEVKDIDVPWKGAAVPDWVKQFRELRYEGGITYAVAGMQPSVTPLTVSIVPRSRENGWLCFATTVVVQAYRLPPQQSVQEGAGGAASVGGLWIAPQGLAALKPGQVIESNDTINTKTVVSDVRPGSVTISEMGAAFRIDLTYDTTSGVLGNVSNSSKDQLGTKTTQFRLTGQQ